MNERESFKEELLDLLNIPEVEKIIMISLERAKFSCATEIQTYVDLKNHFVPTAGKRLMILENAKEIVYRFEIEFHENCSSVSKFEPAPPPGQSITDIIDKDILKSITEKVSDRQKIHSLKNKNKHIEFVRFPSTAFGSIRDSIAKKSNPNDCITLSIDPQAGEFEEMFYYMKKFPQLKASLFTQFYYMLPHFEISQSDNTEDVNVEII